MTGVSENHFDGIIRTIAISRELTDLPQNLQSDISNRGNSSNVNNALSALRPFAIVQRLSFAHCLEAAVQLDRFSLDLGRSHFAL